MPAIRDLVLQLPNHDLIREGVLRPASVRSLITGYLDGDDAAEPIVKQLLAVTAWHDVCCGPSQAGRRSERVPLAVS